MSTTPQFEYVEGQGRPHYPALIQTFMQDSDAVAQRADAMLDVPYGPHSRQRLDAFPSTQPARGVLLYLHAGYWQSRDKSVFRWLASGLNARGLHAVFANYPLCPDVSLAALVDAVAPALAAAHGVMPEWLRLPLVVAGHSAGGHLACEMALRAGNLLQGRGRVDGIWAISGIYDLAPLCETTLNERLQLTPEAAQAMSPLTRAKALDLPAVWMVGADETSEFLRQNRDMHTAWQAQGNPSQCVEVAGADHFTLLQDWDALTPPMNAQWETLWAQVTERHASKSV
ncbi:alpha/beta hydrolase [Achromobacter sp. GG226]|uniref:alpha/beta hydrolase n=1 Tax=Verticiella alkaliphila TaxID=2779529 RepID=UPI001C0C2854|nr:alpha/beta hydrolase [Verticiella sp. GG226]MBU4611775.1 alpha/beta hydrolase [Verticiella sp. GG226]